VVVGTGVGVPFVDPDDLGSEPESFGDIQILIFEARCAPSCHSGPSAQKGLNLELGRAHQSLVDVPSQEVPGMMRVSPGQASQSYLISKLEPSDARRTGSRMPRTGPPYLSSIEIRAIRRWIDAGAGEDWHASDDDPIGGDDDDDDSATLWSMDDPLGRIRL